MTRGRAREAFVFEALALVAVMGACSSTHQDGAAGTAGSSGAGSGVSDGQSGRSGGDPASGAGTSGGGVAASGGDPAQAGQSGMPASGTGGGPSIANAPAGTVVVEGTRLCAGSACAADEVCCLLTGECVAAAAAAMTCIDSGESTARPRYAPADATLCASSADCAADEYCDSDRCLGLGFCTSRTNCPFGDGSVCGCDGIDYPNVQSACFAGARVAGQGSCGEVYEIGAAGGIPASSYTPCAEPDDCGDGEACCAITGRCYDLERSAVCAQPPEGSYAACLDNDDCHFGDVCLGEGCDAPGGCVHVSEEDCTGILEPVCGCDGQSYTSAGCANAALVRVSAEGQCPISGTD